MLVALFPELIAHIRLFLDPVDIVRLRWTCKWLSSLDVKQTLPPAFFPFAATKRHLIQCWMRASLPAPNRAFENGDNGFRVYIERPSSPLCVPNEKKWPLSGTHADGRFCTRCGRTDDAVIDHTDEHGLSLDEIYEDAAYRLVIYGCRKCVTAAEPRIKEKVKVPPYDNIFFGYDIFFGYTVMGVDGPLEDLLAAIPDLLLWTDIVHSVSSSS